jgi:hypothetical protein
METWQINGYTLEYDNESHTYIVDGLIVPSVTQILGVKFGNKYAGVNRSTLERAASRGTAIHEAIEKYCKGDETQIEVKEVRNFRFLMNYHVLNVLENETPVIIAKDGTPIAAGRLDLILKDVNEERVIADIKTTATLDKEYLAYQLNLYRVGYMQSYGEDIAQLYGVHLREDKRKLVKIPINEGAAWDIINEYERGKL